MSKILTVKTSFWLKLSTNTLDHGISNYQELFIFWLKLAMEVAFWNEVLDHQYTVGLLSLSLSSLYK